MNRFNEIDQFLKYYAKVYYQNPSLKITSDTIYSAFMQYGFSDFELKDKNISDKFLEWIEYFKNKPNLNVYHDKNQKYFLQFNNLDYYYRDCYKLYLSFSKDQIFECVKIIFDFIEQNNMPTISKVANIIRSDSVVLRMVYEEDTKKILEFINNHPVLSKEQRKTNPFLLKVENIGLGCDYFLSYNNVISMIIANYLQKCRVTNTLDRVSFYDFKNYVSFIYQEIFVLNSDRGLDYFFNNYQFDSVLENFYSEARCFLNYYQIFRLFTISLDEKFSLNDYFTHVRWCNNQEEKSVLLNQFNKKITDYNVKKSKVSKLQRINNEQMMALYNASLATLKKYGSKHLFIALNKAIDGNYQAITNDGNNMYRQKLMNLVKPYEIELVIESILKKYNLEIEEDIVVSFYKFLIKKELNIVGLTEKTILDDVKTNVLYNASIQTLRKYDINQLYLALKNGVNGNYQSFTNGSDNLYRDKLMVLVKPEEIEIIIKKILDNEDFKYNQDEDLKIVFCQFLVNKLLKQNDQDRKRK